MPPPAGPDNDRSLEGSPLDVVMRTSTAVAVRPQGAAQLTGRPRRGPASGVPLYPRADEGQTIAPDAHAMVVTPRLLQRRQDRRSHSDDPRYTSGRSTAQEVRARGDPVRERRPLLVLAVRKWPSARSPRGRRRPARVFFTAGLAGLALTLILAVPLRRRLVRRLSRCVAELGWPGRDRRWRSRSTGHETRSVTSRATLPPPCSSASGAGEPGARSWPAPRTAPNPAHLAGRNARAPPRRPHDDRRPRGRAGIA